MKALFLLNEFEGNAGGPLGKRASFTLDAQRNMVDNGSITNAVTLNPQTLAIQPFGAGFSSFTADITKVSPRIDYQLSAKHTLMLRYGITHSDVQDNGSGRLRSGIARLSLHNSPTRPCRPRKRQYWVRR